MARFEFELDLGSKYRGILFLLLGFVKRVGGWLVLWTDKDSIRKNNKIQSSLFD